ncbi:hypothetical protein GGR26_001538 [Lewinella marina]|uniref:Uncharacterized protein n=1 Tax=Neolewinella marina TaxID=438751 RepID=A0A2G0CG07_9BACT|nr:hypothetical protein [Neolewinella marina]NJB85793.1 hypothetical protein [Neolewinella marina]PHK98902.1 hypothetical protein CGL56_08655 [Neolewinella marina]
MIATTKHSLKKLEQLLEELGYTVRYEKGNFTSGYCLVEQRRIAIVNRFYDTEGRINVLLEIVGQYDAAPEGVELTPKSEKLFRKIRREVSRSAAEEE